MVLFPFINLAAHIILTQPLTLGLLPTRLKCSFAHQLNPLTATQQGRIVERTFGRRTARVKPQGVPGDSNNNKTSSVNMVQDESEEKMNAIIYDLENPKMVRKPKPILKGSSHILVKIHAAGVNPVDAKKVFGDKLPIQYSPFRFFVNHAVKSCCPGFDFSGVVHEVPTSAADGENCPYHVGDLVYGTAPPFVGTFCEYQILPLDQVQRMPSTLSLVEAAALPITGLSCLQSLAKALPKAGQDTSRHQHLLVIGASGGTGHFAIQYAKRHLHLDRVVGICGTSNMKWVEEELGADHVINYQDGQWQDSIKQEVDHFGPFTCVLDTVFSSQSQDQHMGYEAFLRSSSSSHHKKLLDGMYVRFGGHFTSWFAAGLQRTVGINLFPRNSELFWVRLSQSSSELDTLRQAVDEENVKPYVLQTFPFTEEGVAQAFNALKSRRVRGKIVLTIAP